MAVKIANSLSTRHEGSVFKRLGRGQNVNFKVCVYWLQGRCDRNPCRFLHTESPSRTSARRTNTWTNPNRETSEIRTAVTNEEVSGTKVGPETRKTVSITRGAGFEGKHAPKPEMKLCKFWVNDNCVYGDKCRDLHAWSSGNGFSMLAKLERHSRAITGIALPSGSRHLYSGSKDKSVCVWDCGSGQCAGVIKFDQEIGCLVGDGPCVFVGLPNAIKVWNTQINIELELRGPNSQVNAMVLSEDNSTLFAGTEDGTILVWKPGSENMHPEPVALQNGHSQAVLSLVVGAKGVYSASRDKTIKVWDVKTLECLQTLHGHTDAVTSVICWDRYLISGSLDNTIKVWAATETGSLEVTYERKEHKGVVAFSGIHDAEAKPILLCSSSDNIVRLYDLPSFCERGRVYTKGEARSLEIANGGLFFTGDKTGKLSVWKLHGEINATAQ